MQHEILPELAKTLEGVTKELVKLQEGCNTVAVVVNKHGEIIEEFADVSGMFFRDHAELVEIVNHNAKKAQELSRMLGIRSYLTSEDDPVARPVDEKDEKE